jgi:hypothetical protein
MGRWIWYGDPIFAYRNNRGQFASQREIWSWADASIASTGDSISFMTAGLADHSTPINWWQETMRTQIKHETFRQYMAGLGGRSALTQQDYGSIGGMLSEQYRHLDSFAAKIAAGEYSDKQITAISRMYIRSAHEAFERAAGRARGLPPMPAYPGDGNTRCLTNCACHWRYTKRGNEWHCYWTLSVVEHCFPGQTEISTPTGDLPIEDLKLGDLVDTLTGPRKITRLYEHEHRGAMITIETVDGTVQCTPNHPFLTQRGWIRADNLLANDLLMFSKDSRQQFNGKLAFPNTNDHIPARRQVGILRNITSLLLNLPFSKWLKARVSVPPISVYLDYKLPNPKIDNELSLYDGVTLINDSQGIQHSRSSLLKFGWLSFLKLGMPNKKSFKKFWMSKTILAHALRRAGKMRRIVLSHIFTGLVMDNSTLSSLTQSKAQHIGLSANLNMGFVDFLTNDLGPRFCIILNEIRSLFFCPISTPFCRMPLTEIALSNAVMPAYRARFHNLCRFSHMAVMNIPTSDRAETTIQFTSSLGLNRELSSTLFANTIPSKHELPPNSTILKVYPTNTGKSTRVYNIEVEEAHHYIANGFVVHNCDDCIANAEEWGPLIIPMTEESQWPVTTP